MANAKKCDLCKRLYESPICNDVVRIHIGCGYFDDRRIDLCDDCYNKLCDFVKPALPEDYPVERQKARGTQ